MDQQIVITGMGIFSPIGCNEQTFWDSLCAGRSGAATVHSPHVVDLSRKIACQVHEPIPGNEDVGRASKLAIAAARQAIDSADLKATQVPADRFSLIVGTTMGETEFIEKRLAAPNDEWLSSDHMAQIAKGIPGCIASNVQSALGTKGPAMDMYGACAAGNMAIAAARRSLLAGECDIALAGGADGFSELAFIGFMRLRVMAGDSCRPFDVDRDGLLVGEGAAFLVLEREDSARARNAPIRARLAGTGIATESYHPTRPDPEGDGLRRASLEALRDARLNPDDIGYVCAHGTGTPQNDAIEVKVLDACFPHGVPFSSIKALTGHCMGAAAAVEAVCCVLCLENKTLVPTWNLTEVLRPCSCDAVKDSTRPANIRYAMNNSAGFGGYNSSIIFALP